MKKTVQVLIVLGLLLALIACGGGGGRASGAGDDVMVIIYADTAADNTSGAEGVRAFKEYVERETNGRVRIDLFHNAVLGNDREVLESAQIGTIHIAMTGMTMNSQIVPELMVLDTPFLFETEDEIYKLFDDEIFLGEINKLYEGQNLQYGCMFFQGFRMMTANRPILSVADLAGFNIRVIPQPIPMALWRALGANPTPIAFPEVYTALQQ